MKISRNIIIDLLPIYLANEASDDTRQLIEHHLAQDASLKKLVEQAKQAPQLEEIPMTLNKEHQLKTLEKLKQYSKQRNLFMSLSFLFTGLLLAFRFDGSSISWFWHDSPAAFLLFVLAFFSWVMFTNAAQKLSVGDPQELILQRNVYLGLGIMCTSIYLLLLILDAWQNETAGMLYFLFFFAFVGWIGFANSVRQLAK